MPPIRLAKVADEALKQVPVITIIIIITVDNAHHAQAAALETHDCTAEQGPPGHGALRGVESTVIALKPKR